MRRAPDVEAFVRAPIGAWVVASTSIAWCSSPRLAGCAIWGHPGPPGTREILRAFDAVFEPPLGASVDIVLDAHRVDLIDIDGIAVVVEWVAERRDRLARCVRMQIGVIPAGIPGVTLAGILPAVGDTHPFRVVHAPAEAFDALGAPEVAAEIDALVDEVSGLSPELRRLRELVRERHVALNVEEAARALKLSTRTLQRILRASGTSFQEELRTARFHRALELIQSTSDKVAAIATRVGITEGALLQLFRDRAGATPAELRDAARRIADPTS